jgi:hypothetical protein
MAIRLIREDEQLKCIVSGVTFHYRRLTPAKRQKLRETHTSRGTLDAEAFGNAMITSCVYNWEGDVSLRDTEEPEPFDPSLLAFLPEPVKIELVKIIEGNVTGGVDRVDPS